MNSNVETPANDSVDVPLTVTDVAVRKARALIAENDNPQLKLRVAIHGGGCSGFQYDFSLDADQADDDLVLEREGVCLLVDPLSLPYLSGAEIDYVESLGGSQFVIHNPAARATCSCGSSFTV